MTSRLNFYRGQISLSTINTSKLHKIRFINLMYIKLIYIMIHFKVNPPLSGQGHNTPMDCTSNFSILRDCADQSAEK